MVFMAVIAALLFNGNQNESSFFLYRIKEDHIKYNYTKHIVLTYKNHFKIIIYLLFCFETYTVSSLINLGFQTNVCYKIDSLRAFQFPPNVLPAAVAKI